jgi:diadenylate cyclase
MATNFSYSDILRYLVRQLDVPALLDIALVAVGIYYLLALAKGTRAMQLLKGLATLLVVMQAARTLPKTTLGTLRAAWRR